MSVTKTASGLLGLNDPSPNLRKAIKKAEDAVGKNWQDDANRKILVRMIELNLINRKENDRETLNRRYGMMIDHSEFWREKGIFCRTLLEELDILERKERNRHKR